MKSLAPREEEFSPRIIEIGSCTWVFRSEPVCEWLLTLDSAALLF